MKTKEVVDGCFKETKSVYGAKFECCDVLWSDHVRGKFKHINQYKPVNQHRVNEIRNFSYPAEEHAIKYCK